SGISVNVSVGAAAIWLPAMSQMAELAEITYCPPTVISGNVNVYDAPEPLMFEIEVVPAGPVMVAASPDAIDLLKSIGSLKRTWRCVSGPCALAAPGSSVGGAVSITRVVWLVIVEPANGVNVAMGI